MAAKLRKGDQVVVLAGKDKGKKGEITRVIPKDNKAVVGGVNVAIRHTKQTQASQGGRIAKGDYANHVVELRKRYWLLSVPLQLWTCE